MGITKQKLGNEHEMSINEFSHYLLFPGLFVAFTYNKKQPPAFGAAPAFWCILLSFLGLSFRHIPNNLSNYNVLTANAPFFYQISGTWSNHEGSIFSWCWIPSFYGFLFCYRYRGRPQSHNVSKRRGYRETFIFSFVSNFVKNSILSLQQKSGAAPQLYTPFVRRTLVDSELRSQSKRPFNGPALFNAPLDPVLKMSFALLGAGRSRGSREGKRTNLLLHLARDEKERASSIDEQQIDGALGIALFFSPFLSASSDPFVRNFFVRTEPLAESNPVPQDPISAIHPPCIYAGDVASAMGFGLCRSKMMNGIVALHSPPMRKDAAEKNGTLLRSAGCVGSHIRSSLFTRSFKHFVGGAPALLLRSNRSLLRRRFFAFSSLWTGALMDTGREQAKRVVVRNGKKDTTTSPLCWTAGANTVVSDQDQEPIRIWILTCWLVFNRRHLARKLVGSYEYAGVVSGSVENCVFYASGISHSSYSFSNSTPSSLLDLASEYFDSSMLCLRNLFNTVRIASSRSYFCYRRYTRKIFMAVLPSNYRHIYDSFLPDEAGPYNLYKRDGCGAKYSCAPTSPGSRATPPRYVMEEFSFLLGWLFRASNWLAAGFRPVRSASEVTLAWRCWIL
nr:ccmFN [Zea mays]